VLPHTSQQKNGIGSGDLNIMDAYMEQKKHSRKQKRPLTPLRGAIFLHFFKKVFGCKDLLKSVNHGFEHMNSDFRNVK
jgi:hypothetical protein